MSSRRVSHVVILFGFWLLTLSWVTQAEDGNLKGQISQLLNLGREITVEKFQNGTDEIVLWTEPAEGGSGVIKNWGLVFYEQGKPLDAWFYTGPLTNSFKRFTSSFRQFTKDGRKEFALIGEGIGGNGWAYLFIFNLIDKRIDFLFQGRTNSHTGPIFADLNGDKYEEVFLYSEIQGTLPAIYYWTDIYTWNGKSFVLANNKYPGYYTNFAHSIEKAAADEEKLPNGNARIFYEYLTKVYELQNKREEAARYREKFQLPPDQVGQRVKNLLQVKGCKAHKLIRVDLDGSEPIDAILWAKSIDSQRDYLWLISQNGTLLFEPVLVPLPQTFFEGSSELIFHTKDSQLWIYRKASGQKPGLAYLFDYDRMKNVTFLGIEERHIMENGQILRRVAGQFFTDPDIPVGKSTIIPVTFLQASQSQIPLTIDGLLTEREWITAKNTAVDNIGQVVYGGEKWEGSADLSMNIQATYYGNTLCFGLKVRDANKVYVQKQSQELNIASDHLEIFFAEKEKIYHYGIFNVLGEVQVLEWMGKDVRKLTHNIKAQWISTSDGYTVEIEIPGLNLSGEIYPLTIMVFDTDDGFKPDIDTQLATSPYQVNNRYTLGLIKLQ